MKSNLQRYIPPIGAVLVVCAMMLLAALMVKAADNTEPNKTPQVSYDLEISNGTLVLEGKKTEATLANVVEVLRARYQQANIVIAPGLAQLKISDLKLRAGQLVDELEAVRVASGEKFEVIGPRSGVGPPIDPN